MEQKNPISVECRLSVESVSRLKIEQEYLFFGKKKMRYGSVTVGLMRHVTDMPDRLPKPTISRFLLRDPKPTVQ
jgi:hypothetical protein